MALNGQNKLTPVLVITALCVVGFVLYKAFAKSDVPGNAKPLDRPPAPTAPQPDPKSGKSADADSPTETLKTLTSEVKELKRATQQITDENTQLKNDNNRLQANEDAIVDRVRSSLREEFSSAINNASRQGQAASNNGSTDAASTVVDTIMGGADSVRTLSKGVAATGSDIPPGLGYDNKGSNTSAVPAAGNPAASAAGRYRMIVPIGMKPAEGASGKTGLVKARAAAGAAATGDVNSLLATGEAPASSGPSKNANAADSGDQGGQQKEAVPYFTIPENATLANVTAMTAIVGRIPVDGRVQDPMQFKLLIGRDNLAANGQEIPDDIAGIVVSGIAIGDMTLSCSEGAIQSLTFIFNDGTIRTVSQRANGGMLLGGGAGGTSGGKQSIATSSKLGYISDAYGNPCIAGKFVTNAPSYLTDVIGLKSLTVAANSFAAAQTSTVNSGLGMSSGVTGNKGSYALGQAVGGAADEVTSWVMRRMNNSFDAIVTAAGARVVVHIDQEIKLDKAFNGRKLDYGNLNGPATASSRKRTTRYGLD
ncbi:MAG TPA: TIGR03752 family integrating conjugative element protein [Noviherbaspirillum sp.]